MNTSLQEVTGTVLGQNLTVGLLSHLIAGKEMNKTVD